MDACAAQRRVGCGVVLAWGAVAVAVAAEVVVPWWGL
jgi:hypothetical protein